MQTAPFSISSSISVPAPLAIAVDMDEGAEAPTPAAEAPQLLALLEELGVEQVAGTNTLWAELAWAAEQELVLHLDDLLLRRTRLGLLLACGAAAELPRIRELCQARLGWDDARWQEEEQAYRQLWQRCYSLPAEDGSRGRTAS